MIDEIAYGKAWRALAMSEGKRPRLPKTPGATTPSTIKSSVRRKKVAQLMKQGLGSTEIARRIGALQGTVWVDMQRIREQG